LTPVVLLTTLDSWGTTQYTWLLWYYSLLLTHEALLNTLDSWDTTQYTWLLWYYSLLLTHEVLLTTLDSWDTNQYTWLLWYYSLLLILEVLLTTLWLLRYYSLLLRYCSPLIGDLHISIITALLPSIFYSSDLNDNVNCCHLLAFVIHLSSFHFFKLKTSLANLNQSWAI